jgi:hypothetical protein
MAASRGASRARERGASLRLISAPPPPARRRALLADAERE